MPQESLADRLAAAQAAVTGPRSRVSELEAALTAAVEASDFAAAAEVQEQLPAAREALAVAEVDVRVIVETEAALNAAADAERRQVAEARQRDEAQRAVDAAREAGQQALAAVDSALGVMRGHLAAAQGAYQRALAAEGTTYAAAQQEHQARRALGEEVARYVVGGSNAASCLRDSDPLIQALVGWRP